VVLIGDIVESWRQTPSLPTNLFHTSLLNDWDDVVAMLDYSDAGVSQRQ
jgi:hypothetical protein